MKLLDVVAHLVALFEAVPLFLALLDQVFILTQAFEVVHDFPINIVQLQRGLELDDNGSAASDLGLDVSLNVNDRVPVLMRSSLLEGVHEPMIVDYSH